MGAAQQMMVSYSAGGIMASYATWNPADKGSGIVLSNGNLTMSTTIGSQSARSTISKSTGKWYWEITVGTLAGAVYCGIANSTAAVSTVPGVDTNGECYISSGTNRFFYNSSTSPGGATYTAGDIIGCALDAGAGTITYYKNNVSQGTQSNAITGPYFTNVGLSSTGTDNITANFGATALTYTPPGGYYIGLGNNLPVQAPTYATWNPADKGTAITLSNGNLTASCSGSPTGVRATISKSSGKWYWETTIGAGSTLQCIGIANAIAVISNFVGGDVNGYSYYGDGRKISNNVLGAYGSAFTSGDIIGIALDMTAGTLAFYKNNVSQGVAFTGITGAMFAAEGNTVVTLDTTNFGATALTYTPPTGFNAGLYN